MKPAGNLCVKEKSMTDEPVQRQAQSRLELAEIQNSHLANSVEEDLKQFRRLRAAFPDLPNEELAHRLIMSTKQLAKVIKQALTCGDLVRHVRVSDGGQNVVYVPYAETQFLDDENRKLRAILIQNNINIPRE